MDHTSHVPQLFSFHIIYKLFSFLIFYKLFSFLTMIVASCSSPILSTPLSQSKVRFVKNYILFLPEKF